jgi:hypothetical protein
MKDDTFKTCAISSLLCDYKFVNYISINNIRLINIFAIFFHKRKNEAQKSKCVLILRSSPVFFEVIKQMKEHITVRLICECSF